MDQSTALQPGTVALEPPSTVLNPQTVEHISGGGKPALTEKDNSGSIESVLEAELAEMKAQDKPAEKEAAEPKEPKEDDKPAKPRAEDGKFAKAQDKAEAEPDAKADKSAPPKGAVQEAPERRPSEGRHPEPPARFLPEARAKWANVPNEVKAEFHRVSQEMEQETGQYRASHERYSQLKDFDELARSNGRDLRESLLKVNEVENAMARNPIAGLDAILLEIGPRKSDGSPLTIMDVANYLTQNPQAYQPQMAMPQPSAQPQANPEIAALKAEVQSLRAEQTVVPVIQRFADAHTDFDAIQGRIEQILTSGVIEQLYGNGLSLEQKLSEAYRMAGGQGPSSRPDTEAALSHSAAKTERPVNPDAGTKSVRGAPADGADTKTEEPETEIGDLLRKEMRKLRVA